MIERATCARTITNASAPLSSGGRSTVRVIDLVVKSPGEIYGCSFRTARARPLPIAYAGHACPADSGEA